MICRFLAILLLCTAFAGATAHARSQPLAVAANGPESVIEVDASAIPQSDKVTLEEAVRRVRKQYGGRIVSAETRGGSKRTHVIKVLTDKGRVVTVRIPAN